MSPRSSIGGFLLGIGSFFIGVRLLASRRGLQVLALAPFLTTTLTFCLLFVFAWQHFDSWKDAFFARHQVGFWNWPGVELLLVFLFVALLLLAVYLSFVVIGGVVAAPFNDLLSQRVEDLLLRGPRPSSPGLRSFLRDSVRGASQAILRLSIYVALVAASLPLLFLPIVGPFIFPAIMALISIRFLAWDGVDYCLSRRRLSFREKAAFMKANRSATVGYGTISFVLLAVPFLALFTLPVLAVGGTVLFCRVQSEAKAPR